MIFILAIGGVWVFLLASLFFLVAWIVTTVRWRRIKRRSESGVATEELAAAKRLMITNGLVLLILSAAFLVCTAVVGIGLSSM